MSLLHEYLDHKKDRAHIPFDTEGDTAFVQEALGMNLGDFCKRIFKEILEIEKRLDMLDK